MWPCIYLHTGTHVSKHTSSRIHMHRGYFDNTVNSSSSKHCGGSYNLIQKLSLNFSSGSGGAGISSCTGALALNHHMSIKTMLSAISFFLHYLHNLNYRACTSFEVNQRMLNQGQNLVMEPIGSRCQSFIPRDPDLV